MPSKPPALPAFLKKMLNGLNMRMANIKTQSMDRERSSIPVFTNTLDRFSTQTFFAERKKRTYMSIKFQLKRMIQLGM